MSLVPRALDQDAPPFDPSVWADDCFVLSRLARDRSRVHGRKRPAPVPEKARRDLPPKKTWREHFETVKAVVKAKLVAQLTGRPETKIFGPDALPSQLPTAQLEALLREATATGNQLLAAECAAELARRGHATGAAPAPVVHAPATAAPVLPVGAPFGAPAGAFAAAAARNPWA